MKIEGMIKSVQAAIAAGGADVTQILKIEVLEGDWRQLRDLMQKPIKITIEASQMTFGEKSPMDKGSVETTGTTRGRKKKEAVPA
jgi:hypothetical protein